MNYFIYRHVRLDTKQVFYIGMGKIPPEHRIYKHRTKYSRAYQKAKRSKHWKAVTALTDYKIEIILSGLTEEEAIRKEKEFIKLYGKTYDGTGTLINIGDGGKGCIIKNKNYKLRITQLSLDKKVIKIWNNPKEIQQTKGYLKTNIIKCCRKKALSAYGFLWEYTDDRSYDHIYPSAKRTTSNNRKGIIVTDNITKDFKIYRTLEEVAQTYHYHRSTIQKYISKKSKHKFLTFEYQI